MISATFFYKLNCMKKQEIGRTYSGIKMASLEDAMQALNINGSYSNVNLQGKDYYNLLNKHQKRAYNNIQDLIAEKRNAVILIDAPSGTGKTFLLCALAKMAQMSPRFIAFRRDQASDISSIHHISSETYVSFCMKQFNLDYKHAVHMFDQHVKCAVEQLYHFILYLTQYSHCNVTTIILDTYTIAPPKMILLLYLVALKHNINLIFAGSSLQPDAIVRSTLHDENNFSLIQSFNDVTVQKLSRNMRVCDPCFDKNLTNFLQDLQSQVPSGRVKFHFDLRYKLFCMFPSKYFAEERFDTVYIAQSHALIKQRLMRFIDHLKATGTPYVEVPFFKSPAEGPLIPIVKFDNKRFIPNLILVEGYKYIHVNENGFHSVVELVRILRDKNNAVESLQVRYVNGDNSTFPVTRCILNYYQILPSYRFWLLSGVKGVKELFQFPLRHYALTYHAAVGRTIETEDVELNADCIFANSIYIGLSCVRSAASINKIHTRHDILSYVVTLYMEQEHKDFEYYYRCQNMFDNEILVYVTKKEINNFIENLEWIEVSHVFSFERGSESKTNVKIKRSVYESSSQNKKKLTPFMEVAEFIKEKTNVILETMKKVSGSESINLTVKKRKKAKQKKEPESLAYDYLKKEYDTWANLRKNQGKGV